MKKGTRAAIFLISMAFTIGSLFAFVGPRYCGYGMHQRAVWMNHHQPHQFCGHSEQMPADSDSADK